MRATLLLSLLLLSNACHTNPLRSLERSLGISDLRSFKRDAKQERWNLSDKPTWNRQLLLKDITNLGFVNTIEPSKQHYKSAVLLGATGPRMQTRIDYLIEVWNQGTRFERIVFLTGDRDLGEIDKASNPGLAKNETELLKQLWAKAALPEELKRLPVLWVDSPKIKNPDGSLQRPNTVSTIETWRRQEDIAGEDLLAFSNQPLVYYQQCALLNYLPKDVTVETVGPAADLTTLIAVYLDTLASCLEFCPSRSEFQNRLSAF